MPGLTEKAVDDTEKEMKRADNRCCDVVVGVEKHARLIFNDQGVVVVDGLHGRIQMSGPCSNSYYSFDYSLDKKKTPLVLIRTSTAVPLHSIRLRKTRSQQTSRMLFRCFNWLVCASFSQRQVALVNEPKQKADGASVPVTRSVCKYQ